MEESENESNSSGDYVDANEYPFSYSVASDEFRRNLERHRVFVEERMDPDHGLVERLRETEAIDYNQVQIIRAKKVPFKKSRKILDFILEGNASKKITKFREALRDTKQQHLINYVEANGVYMAQFVNDWPLGEREIKIIDNNLTFLMRKIDTACGLLAAMYKRNIITLWQMERVSEKPGDYEKNTALLDIIRRGSLSEYKNTIDKFFETNQKTTANILREGGEVVQIHSRATGKIPITKQDDEKIAELLNSMSGETPEERDRLLELARLKNSGLIDAVVIESIGLFFHCKNSSDFVSLLDLLKNKELQRMVEVIYNEFISTSTKIEVTLTWSNDEFSRVKRNLLEMESAHEESQISPVGVGAKSELEDSFNEDDGTATSNTVMNHLPLELLDMILRKVYRNSCVIGNRLDQSTDEDFCVIGNRLCQSTDEEIVLSLASVDYCWFQRIIRRTFKNKIWRNLKGFYKKCCKRVVVCRNTRLYMVESIQTKSMLKQLRSADCLTDIQTRLVNRGEDTRLVNKGKDTNRRLNGNKEELVLLAKSLDDSRYSAFVQCLYDNKQNRCARVASNGGVVVKAEIQSLNLENRKSVEQQMVKKLKYLRDRSKSKSPTLERQLKRLKAEGNEILDSLLDRNPVVWLWCHTESGLSKLQADFDLVLKLFNLGTNTRPSEIVKVKTVNIDSDRFRKEVVETLGNALNNVAMPEIKQILAERMNPDFGILDKLLVYKAFSKAEIIEVRTLSTSHKRNSRLIELATQNEELINLFHALKDTRQEHLVNYVTSEGEYSQEYGGAWPLTERETSILDANQESLVDFLDFTGDEIISKLYEVKVLNRRQTEFICKQPYDYEKAEVLLDFLYRSSLSDYWKMITCLRDTNQQHIAKILLEGATAAVRVHNALDGETQSATAVENETVTRSENILSSMNLRVEINENTMDNVAIPEIKKMLVERIIAEFGILDKLLASKALSRTEIAEVKQLSSSQLKNSRLLELATKNEKLTELFNALKDTHQEHLVNYVTSEGVYNEKFGDDWPLGDDRIRQLNVNQEILIDIIEPCDSGLIGLLYSARVINKRQHTCISDESSSIRKNRALLNIIRRQSIKDYNSTIRCLIQSKQQHIAEILQKSGVIQRIRVSQGGDPRTVNQTEHALSDRLADLFRDRPVEEAQRIMEMTQLKKGD